MISPQDMYHSPRNFRVSGMLDWSALGIVSLRLGGGARVACAIDLRLRFHQYGLTGRIEEKTFLPGATVYLSMGLLRITAQFSLPCQ